MCHSDVVTVVVISDCEDSDLRLCLFKSQDIYDTFLFVSRRRRDDETGPRD